MKSKSINKSRELKKIYSQVVIRKYKKIQKKYVPRYVPKIENSKKETQDIFVQKNDKGHPDHAAF